MFILELHTWLGMNFSLKPDKVESLQLLSRVHISTKFRSWALCNNFGDPGGRGRTWVSEDFDSGSSIYTHSI